MSTTTVASPLRTLQLSTTSSCTKLAVWIISVISASRRCWEVMSLQAHPASAPPSVAGWKACKLSALIRLSEDLAPAKANEHAWHTPLCAFQPAGLASCSKGS